MSGSLMDDWMEHLPGGYVSFGKLAASLGVSPRTLSRWRKASGAKEARMGKEYYVEGEVIRAWRLKNLENRGE